MTRRFEFVAGNSAKFWEIRVAASDVIVRFGRLGTVGQMQVKTFTTAESAHKRAEKLIAQKTAKGYVECAAA